MFGILYNALAINLIKLVDAAAVGSGNYSGNRKLDHIAKGTGSIATAGNRHLGATCYAYTRDGKDT